MPSKLLLAVAACVTFVPLWHETHAVPAACTQAERWTINGRAFVEEYRGRVLFLVFLNLKSATSISSIRRLDDFLQTNNLFNEVKIVIVAPHDEAESRIASVQARFPLVKITKETDREPLWGWLRVGLYDGLVYDRCGRLARHIRIPSNGVKEISPVFDAIREVRNGQTCGACAYDHQRRQNPYEASSTPQQTVNMLTAYVSPATTTPMPKVVPKKNSEITTTPDTIYPDIPVHQTNEADPTQDDYYEYVAEWTTPVPQDLQIPRPTQPMIGWPTKVPFTRYGGYPCAGFTDEICYKQQHSLDEGQVHRCCRDRIVLTDQCVPGKCSNATTQLCCVQKFLQAKWLCCSDETQSLPTTATDQFSRCCYDNFVNEATPCCPRQYAADHWKTAHEVCLPNVSVDLSDVKIQTVVPGTSVTTYFDLGKSTAQWKFACKFGNHVQQYSFFESEDVETTPSTG